ncbi:GEVED domain-containing protein, partial [Flavivirga jejuensis]
MKHKYLLLPLLFVFSFMAYAQENQNKAFYHGKISSVEHVSSMLSRPHDLTSPDNSFKEAKDKRSLGNQIISGKDPQTTNDYYLINKHEEEQSTQRAPASLVFDTYSSNSQPTDPSMAVGPNHVMVVFNTGFMVYDKSGNQLLGETSPNPAIFPSGGCCDLTVSYDNAADRWVLSFLGSGAQIAVSDGPNPLTAGWYVYNISAIQDYQKLSIWSDGYYITDNSSSSNKLWALERDVMLTGGSGAQIIGFNLPGIVTSGFYSPQVLNVTDANLPAPGGATIIYLQDDAWSGVSQDHIKVWTADLDWNNPGSSTVSNSQEINTTPFISVFDNGSFSNLSQPGGGATIDALQATIMNQAQFRKFATHNSALFNFVVDTDASSGELAGIRWYEFRQSGDNQPWSLYQEGTYTAPDGRHAWTASLAMDGQGNIGMGYTSMSGPTTPTTVRVSSYFTGRLSSDPLGTMTSAEELIANGNGNIPSYRYGDYSKIDVDPSDDSSFWYITEYVNGSRKGVVGKFQIEAGIPDTEAPTDPTNMAASNITASGATLSWIASTDNVGVVLYNISIDGTVVGTSTTTSFNVTGLSPSTSYVASVTAQDAAGNVSGNDTVSFTTIAGNVNYCSSASTNINDEFIGNVQLNTINNNSGGQFYSDFTSISTNLNEGETYTVTVVPTWPGSTYSEAYAVWIDYNNNGSFDDTGELVWSKAPSTDTSNSGSFTVPNGTSGTSVRMRVSLKYNGIPTSCETFTYGEVEDYTINLGTGTPDTEAPTDPTNMSASNITASGATLSWIASTDNVGVVLYNISIGGTLVGTSTTTSFNVTGLSPSTPYVASVTAQDAAGNVSGNDTVSFTTIANNINYCSSASTNI